MKNTYNILSFLFLALFVCSCGSEVEAPGDDVLKLDYMPVEIGKFWVYQNDSIVYDFGGAIVDTMTSYSKEEIVESYEDESGSLVHVVERSFKKNLNDSWELSDAWTCQKDSSQFIKTEENIKFLKLIFPPLAGSDWDGNVFFDDDIWIKVAGESLQPYRYWDYKVSETDLSLNVGSTNFENVMRVDHVDLREDSYEWRFGYEHYARGIGLVQRTLEVLDAQCEPNCVGTFYDWAEKGYRIEQQLIDYN